MQKVLQCLCLPCWGCYEAECIDQWHGCEACGLCYLYCDACAWTLCAPICIECKCGDCGKAGDNCLKSLKYCAFACALDCVAWIDGLYNCGNLVCKTCKDGVTGHKDLLENSRWLN